MFFVSDNDTWNALVALELGCSRYIKIYFESSQLTFGIYLSCTQIFTYPSNLTILTMSLCSSQLISFESLWFPASRSFSGILLLFS